MTLSFLPYHAPSTLALSLSLPLPNSVASIYRLACIPLLRQLPRRNKLTKFPPPSSIHRASSPRSSSSPGWIPALLVPHLETRTRGAKTKEENNEEKKIKKEERERDALRTSSAPLPSARQIEIVRAGKLDRGPPLGTFVGRWKGKIGEWRRGEWVDESGIRGEEVRAAELWEQAGQREGERREDG